MLYKDITIHIENGLKSRGAAMFVHVAGKYESQILIEVENKKINGKSIMGVLSLGVNKGESVTVVANGKDEKEAVAALEKLAHSGHLEPGQEE